MGGVQCHWCSRKTTNRQYDLEPTIDHVIPLSEGGADTMKNKVWACRACNELKGGMGAEHWQIARDTLGSEFYRAYHQQKLRGYLFYARHIAMGS